MALSEDVAVSGRRLFLRAAAGALVSLAWPGHVEAADRPRRVLVCVNLVGGLDGMSALVPFGEDAYYRARPKLAIAPPGRPNGAILLTDGLGLHPSLAPLHPLFLEGTLAIVPAAGGAHFGRSHFAARSSMHSGAPANDRSAGDASPSSEAASVVRSGWANRLADVLTQRGEGGRLYSTTPTLSRALAGAHPVETTARSNLAKGDRGSGLPLATLRRLYQGRSDPFALSAEHALERAAELREKFRSIRLSGDYGKAGRGLRDAAQVILADVGAEIIWVEIAGFDTHKAQGGAHGSLSTKLAHVAQALTAFRHDLGQSFADVAVVTFTEFGRTLRENGAGGTDHGSASCMLVLGGRVRGGQLVGGFPGLGSSKLHEGRELAVATDYRTVLAELASAHLGVDPAGLASVFPGFPGQGLPTLGLMDQG